MSNLLFESIDNKQILEPELQTWLFMTSPYQVFGIIAAYLYFVLLFGPNFMKTREPFKLKNTLLIYNFYNVVFSSIIVIISVCLSIRDDVFNNLCNKGVPAESVTAMSHISWWYFFSKIVELLDTVFFVLRKKQNQVTFLHIYHHTVMVISCWVYLKYLPGNRRKKQIQQNTVVSKSETDRKLSNDRRIPNEKQLLPDKIPSSTNEIPVFKSSNPQSNEYISPDNIKAEILLATENNSEENLVIVQARRRNIRKGGTLGNKIEIETNHIALNFKPKYDTAYHYDINIEPEMPKRVLRQIWNKFRLTYLNNYPAAFDEVKNVYAPGKLPIDDDGTGFDTVKITENDYGPQREYKVTIKFASVVNLNSVFEYMDSGNMTNLPQNALQCIDIVLRNVAAAKFVRIGRSYYKEPNQIIDIGDGLQLWYGHYQSAVIAWKPLLNVDVAHKGFPIPQTVPELIAYFAKVPVADIEIYPWLDHKVSHFLKGLKIQFEIPNQPNSRRRYRVNGIVLTPREMKFKLNNKVTTVSDYYRIVKKYQIIYPNLPCLWVGAKDKQIYIPAEICTIIAGQVTSTKLNDSQTANLIKKAATDTGTRKSKIMASMQHVNFNADPVVQAFGLSVGKEFECVKARVISPPDLQYNNNTVRVCRGQWRPEIFLKAEKIINWTILSTTNCASTDLLYFINMLKTGTAGVGMEFAEPRKPFASLQIESKDLRKLEEYFVQMKRMQIIFVIIPDKQSEVYAKIKQVAELKVGILTQCVKDKTLSKMTMSTIGNILLKVNAKLNGKNHSISENFLPSCLKEPCMIMGADVTHPSSEQTNVPSIAAVCATYDASAFRYNFCWRLQAAKQEIITDLDNIVSEQLRYFYNVCKQKPKRIIFFRDGVSEGQFAQVMNAEILAIRRACSKFGNGGFKPAITFLVVQKRHHTRFFPKNPNDADKNGNVLAGTIVDTDITHPTAIEYYLVSHTSIQGTARPTKYRVLYDDNQMTEDDLETLTYYLCHMFSRCTRSVSYPAPTYYAHLAAFRIRSYIEGQPVDLESLTREQDLRKIQELFLKKQPMFFV